MSNTNGKTTTQQILTPTGDRKVIAEAQSICLDIVRMATEQYLKNPTPELEKAIKEVMAEYKKTKEQYRL